MHLEEDTGKSLHVGGSTGRIHGAAYSLVDYNRAGIPLVEIVTQPVTGAGAAAPAVARAYVTELREVLRALGVSDVRMEQGSLRCDVNLSLTPRGRAVLGTRTETKNVNSLRSVERAVRSEIERQAAVLDAGGTVVQETRHFHEDTGDHHARAGARKRREDYRYFPEPDLVPLAPAPRVGRADPAVTARAAGGAPGAPAQANGVFRHRHGAMRTPASSTWSPRPSRPARRRPRPQVVARRAGPSRQRDRHRAGRPGDHPGRRWPGSRELVRPGR